MDDSCRLRFGNVEGQFLVMERKPQRQCRFEEIETQMIDENLLAGHFNIATAATQMMDISIFTETATESDAVDEPKQHIDENPSNRKEDYISLLTVTNVERNYGSADKVASSPTSEKTYTSDHLPVALSNNAQVRESEILAMEKSVDKAGNFISLVITISNIGFTNADEDSASDVSSNESVNIFAVPITDTLIDEEPFTVEKENTSRGFHFKIYK